MELKANRLTTAIAAIVIGVASQVVDAQRCPNSRLTLIVRDQQGQPLDAATTELTYGPKEQAWGPWSAGSADFLNQGYFAKQMVTRVPPAIAQLNGKLQPLVKSKPCGFTEPVKLELAMKGKKMKLVFRPDAPNDHAIDYMVDSPPFQEGIFDITLTLEKDEGREAYFYPASGWLKITEAEEAFYDGEERLEKRDYEHAIELFQKALALDPRKAEAAFFIGDANINLKRYEAAIAALKQATGINPSSATSFSLLGTAYRLNQRHKEAVEAYSTALNISVKDEHWSAGWDKNTRAYLTKSQNALDPNYRKSAEEYFDEGRAYLDDKKFPEAVESLKQAIKLKPDYALAHGFLGQAYRPLNRNDEAIEALKEAIRLEPNSAVFHGILGETYLDLKKYRESVTELERALQLKPADRWRESLNVVADELFQEAVHDVETKAYENARDKLLLVNRINPNADLAFAFLGIAYLRLKNYPEAVTALKEALRLEPKKASTWAVLGDVYSAQEQNQDAVAAYTEAVRLAPDDKDFSDALKESQDALNAPSKDVVKKQAETLWRADHAAEITKAGDARFEYQSITLKPSEQRPPGAAATDLLYSANVKLSATLGNGQPASSTIFSVEINQCFYKKRDMPTWSVLPCTRNYFVKVDSKVLDTYVGQYQMPKHTEDKPAFVVNLFREGEKLISEAFGNRIEFRPVSETEFYLKEEDRIVKFIRNAQGQVTHIVWDNLTVKKIK
jgi:tetratricopeptide (TPR) repeat protein